MKKVIGIGGIFMKSQNKAAMKEWYAKHLGLTMEDWGLVLPLSEQLEIHPESYQVMSIFPADSKYFEPSTASFMLNLVVADLQQLIAQLTLDGIELPAPMQDTEYGKFAWVLDPDGNKLELWEPAPAAADSAE